MISSDIALIGTTIHRVAQLIQQRIDQDIRDSGLTRLSWMAAAHVEDAPCVRSVHEEDAVFGGGRSLRCRRCVPAQTKTAFSTCPAEPNTRR